MPDMDLSSMKEGTKATPSYCHWSPATEQARETEIERSSRAARRLVTLQKCAGKNAARLGGRVKPATAAIKSKSPGANPGFPST
jgi:hypothetical protein